MNQDRKDTQDKPNRQSNMEPAEGSRESERTRGQQQGGSSGARQQGQRSALDDQESFEHGTGSDDVARGMGSSSGRGTGSNQERNMGSSRERNMSSNEDRARGGGITNRGTEREQDEQDQLPERGRSQSER